MAVQILLFALYQLNTCKPSKFLQEFCPQIGQWATGCKTLLFWLIFDTGENCAFSL